MSSKNDEANGLAIAGAFFALMAVVLFALVAFVAAILTILCFFAWNKPVKLGPHTITPEEAHTFVYRGIAGAILAPVFAVFMCFLFGFKMDPDLWFYLIVGGYSFGSLVIGMIDAQEQERAVAAAQYQALEQQIVSPPRPEPVPFKFASWNDEDERK